MTAPTENERDVQPSAVIIDSQSVKATAGGAERGFDAGTKVDGRKRHVLVDTLGRIIAVVVHAPSVQDRDGARKLFARAELRDRDRLLRVRPDGAHAGELVEWADETFGLHIEIVSKRDGQQGFEVLPRRWRVERPLRGSAGFASSLGFTSGSLPTARLSSTSR